MLALAGRHPRWLVPIVYAVCGVAFFADLLGANELAYGVFYIPLVVTALLDDQKRSAYRLAAFASALVLVGAFFPFVAPDLPTLVGNRVLSVLAIFATAAFVDHARTAQARLAKQTERAEAAERIKTEVFANLSQEMRTPLHGLLGLLNLMVTTCRPDQQHALERVRDGSTQLLASIDNLIDLTQVDDRQLCCQPVDVAVVLRQAADSARSSATERDVAIEVGDPVHDATAIGDAWAVRRILDNLIANAVRYCRPGDVVSVKVARGGASVTASVTDPGVGMRPKSVAQAGVGLTLSERLALAMNGRLAMAGQTVSLSLPAA
jgi:hypothetical protein